MWIVAIIFLALVLPIVFCHSLDFHRRYTRHTGDIVNHDPHLRVFVYSVEKSEAEILFALESHSVYTAIKYRFHKETNTVTFSPALPDGSLDITYRIQIIQQGASSLLQITQIDHLWEKNPYALLQNEFWHQLLGAIPVRYSLKESAYEKT